MMRSRLISVIREPHWLNRKRVIAWGSVLLGEQALMLIFLALWQNGLLVEVKIPTSSDFVSFYAAGKLTLAGTPMLAYDPIAHQLAQQNATMAGASYQFFFYPPVFLFLCAGFAWLPYLVAFALFQMVTLAAALCVMRSVLREKGWAWIAPVLAYPAIFWNIGVGQNAFLSAALLGGFTLLIDRRPRSAGMLLGFICYKPHFGLLAPIALAAGRRWRAFSTALGTVAVLVGASIVLFGWATWAAYFAALAGSREIYQSGRIDFAGMVSVFGGARLLGFAPGYAYAVQAITALAMAGLVALIWRGGTSLPLRGASLLAATLLAVPLVLLYDQMLALVATGWLVREAREQGFLPWEKILLLTTYPLSLVIWMLARGLHLPLGPVVNVILLCLCLRRAWRAFDAPVTVATQPVQVG